VRFRETAAGLQGHVFDHENVGTHHSGASLRGPRRCTKLLTRDEARRALAGEEPDVVRDEVRVALTDCKEILRAQEEKKRISLGSLSRPRLLCVKVARLTSEISSSLRVIT
jgi:hypothetical protein